MILTFFITSAAMNYSSLLVSLLLLFLVLSASTSLSGLLGGVPPDDVFHNGPGVPSVFMLLLVPPEVFSAAEVMRLAAGALGRRPPPWPRTTTCPSPGRRRCSGSWQSARTPHRARALRPPVPRGGGREEEVGCLARARECGLRPPHHRALVWSSPGCCNMWGID